MLSPCRSSTNVFILISRDAPVSESNSRGHQQQAQGTPPVSAGQPEQSVRRKVSPQEIQAIVFAASLLSSNFHLAVEKIAEIRSDARLLQVCSNITIKPGEFLRVGFVFLDFVVHDGPTVGLD